jgi:multisubunit Na+/H+ antiporter MnhC subunit
MSRHTDNQMTREQVWVLTAITFGMAMATIILMARVVG